MKLTKKFLAVLLSVLLVMTMALPVVAEDVVTPPTAEELAQQLEAAKTALQTAVDSEINYNAYEEDSTADFADALEAAKAELAKEDATAETLNAALAAMETAKEKLVLLDGIAGAFAANNKAATMSVQTGVVQMDWTLADQRPIDLSKSDLAKTFIAFTLTLTSANEEIPVADAFKTGNMVLRSVRTTQENKVEYSVAKFFTDLKEGENEIKICLANFTNTAGEMDWSQLEAARLFFDSTNGKEGPFTMKMDNIRILDETPEDYKPVEGTLATFRDDTVYTNKGGDDKTLPGEWSTITPIDVSDKDLSKVYLVVNYTLNNNTTMTDAEIFHTGYFRLRSADTGALPDGENNVGYSIKDLMDREIIAQPATGENTVKIPLTEYNTEKGTMDWSTLTKFRLYFDNLPAGLDADTLALSFNSVTIVDENVELEEGVVGVFEDDTTYETNVKVLETPWIKAGKAMDVSDILNYAYLHVNLTLTGAEAGAFNTGYIRLRSTDTPSEADPVGENNVGYSIKHLLDLGLIEELTEGENDLYIPMTAFNDEKGVMDWTDVSRFRIYINLQEEGMECTLKLNTVEIIDESGDVDPTLLGSFSEANGTYEASEEKALQTTWANADFAFDASNASDEAFLRIVVALTNSTGADDADVFKTGKILLASKNTPTETDEVGENSVSVSIERMILDEVITLKSGENVLEIPLSAFAEEKGTIDWTAVSRFRMFIDSTNKQTGATSMTITEVEVIDPALGGGDDPIDPPVDKDVYGNVDGSADGNVTANDALVALQAATGKVTLDLTTEILADVNGDFEVTAEDALLILQYATQKITAFPVEG